MSKSSPSGRTSQISTSISCNGHAGLGRRRGGHVFTAEKAWQGTGQFPFSSTQTHTQVQEHQPIGTQHRACLSPGCQGVSCVVCFGLHRAVPCHACCLPWQMPALAEQDCQSFDSLLAMFGEAPERLPIADPSFFFFFFGVEFSGRGGVMSAGWVRGIGTPAGLGWWVGMPGQRPPAPAPRRGLGVLLHSPLPLCRASFFFLLVSQCKKEAGSGGLARLPVRAGFGVSPEGPGRRYGGGWDAGPAGRPGHGGALGGYDGAMVLRRAEREEGNGGGAVSTAHIGQKACADSSGFLTG